MTFVHDNDEDAGVLRAAQDLQTRLATLVGKPMTGATVRKAVAIIEDHRAHWLREHGVRFPPMVPLVFRGVRHIELVRADHDATSLQDALRRRIAANPEITAEEIAWAVQRAFPGYNPLRDSGISAAVRAAVAEFNLKGKRSDA